MAIFKSPLIDNTVYPRTPHTGVQVMTLAMEFSGSASVSAGDVVQIFPVVKGMTVHSVRYAGVWGEAASSAGHSITIGDGLSTARYVAAVSVSASIVLTQSTVAAGAGYTYTADDTVDVSLTDVATSATAGGTMTFELTYSMGGGDR